MLGSNRRTFLWSIGALAFLLWAAAYGAFSGMQSAQSSGGTAEGVAAFILGVKMTDVLLVIFSALLTAATVAAGKHYRQSERAYLKLSHYSPPDIAPSDAALWWSTHGNHFFAVIQVKNHGDTPATVTEVLMTYALIRRGQQPPPPTYAEREVQRFSGAFLVRNDHIRVHPGFHTLTDNEKADVDRGELRLWLHGYVDYEDAFGQRHRAGYGRVYAAGWIGNNLEYEPSHYNYDRPLDVAAGTA